MEYIKITQPREFEDFDESELLKRYTMNYSEIQRYVERISEDKYRFWDKARHKETAEGFTAPESWYLARIIRKLSSKAIPVKTPEGESFTWMRLNYTDELLREIDMYAGGSFLIDGGVRGDATQRQKYLTRGIMEEAIASSQLEGADTSRRYAKKMIAENIKPRNASDYMILNNYRTLSKIDDEYKDQELSREVLLELHSQLTSKTFEDESDSGRFRTDDDDIVVKFDGKIAHVPPEEKKLHSELDRLIAYANDTKTFIHPVIKAIILHFWIGYLHPFPDGNGRIARTIFYWYMLKHNYWAVMYLPISLVIKRAPVRYTFSYVYAEQDNFDFTYFYDYNIKQIIKAIHEFKEYADRISNENALINEKLKSELRTNDRQKQIIHFVLGSSENHTSVTSHAKLSGITRQTAAKDISALNEADLLRPEPYGNSIRYFASEKLKQLAD